MRGRILRWMRGLTFRKAIGNRGREGGREGEGGGRSVCIDDLKRTSKLLYVQ